MPQDGSFYLFTFLLFTRRCSEVQNKASGWLILPYYFLPWVLWGQEPGLETVQFTFLPGGCLRSISKCQDRSFYLFSFWPFYLGVLWSPDSGLKTAHFTFLTFYLFAWGCSEDQIQASIRIILHFYFFTWGCSEVQIYVSRRLILPFTFLPFSLGLLWGQNQTSRRLILPF